MNNVHIKTHRDLDGAGAVILAHYAKLPIKSVSYHTYTTIDNSIQKFISSKSTDSLLITDICPSRSVCTALDVYQLQTGNSVRLLDHHKTRKFVNMYPWATMDVRKCGTELVYKEFDVPKKYKKLVNAISAWDLWKKQDPNRVRGERLNTLLGFIGITEFVARFKANHNADNEKDIKLIINYVEERKRRYINQVIKTQLSEVTTYMDGCGQNFTILVAGDYISELADAVLYNPEFDDVQYVCIISPNSNTCSLRSREEESIDVSNLAKLFGGGGHAHAAGFPFNARDNLTLWISKILNRIES